MGDLPPRRGIIFILSAPSGAGKTTIARAALARIPALSVSVSLTTRAPREGEVDASDYHFVTDDEFSRRVERGELAEWARVFDARYGTPRKPLDDAIGTGRDMLLDIDVQGARQLKRVYPRDAVTIFVLPPSFDELEERLRKRGTENEAAISRRLKRARDEAGTYPEYDYLVINDDVNESVERLLAVVNAERSKVSRLREGFAPWKS